MATSTRSDIDHQHDIDEARFLTPSELARMRALLVTHRRLSLRER
jgi:hypothetical protein